MANTMTILATKSEHAAAVLAVEVAQFAIAEMLATGTTRLGKTTLAAARKSLKRGLEMAARPVAA